MAVREYYSEIEEAQNLSGIRPGDLDSLPTQDSVEDQIESWLRDIKDLIDTHLKRDFAYEEELSRPEGGGPPARPVPRGIHLIAARALRNLVSMARLSVNAGQANPDEFAQIAKQNADEILTDTLLKDLNRYRDVGRSAADRAVRLRVMPGRTKPGFTNPTYGTVGS